MHLPVRLLAHVQIDCQDTMMPGNVEHLLNPGMTRDGKAGSGSPILRYEPRRHPGSSKWDKKQMMLYR